MLTPVHRWLAASLHDAGFTTVFGLIGEDTAGLAAALAERGARYVAARHETTAVSMADGYARATGGVGLCIVSRGPGLLNALGAAVSADRAGTALLVVTGDTPRSGGPADAAGDLKAMDQLAAAAAIGLRAIRPPDVGALPAALDEALETAAGGRAVVLSVPVDVLEAAIDAAPGADHRARRRTEAPVVPEEAALDAVAARLASASHPLLLAGAGAVKAGAGEALETLAERVGAMLGTTLAAKGLFAGHPDDVGVVGGLSDVVVREQLAGADLVVAFGAGLNRFTTAAGALMPQDRVVQVDSDSSRLGLLHPVAIGLHGDARLVAEGLLPRLPADHALSRPRSWRRALAARDGGAGFTDHSSQTAADPRALLRALDELLPAERNVVVDCGHFAGFPAQHLSVTSPDRFFWSLHFGTLGVGHGLSFGVAMARPDEPTLAVIGDGGLLMTLGELETLSRIRPRVILVVLDDGAYAAEKHFLELHGQDGDLAVFGVETDFAGIAARLGLPAVTVRSTAGLQSLADELRTGRGPLVLDCKVPLVRAGWYEEMLTGRFAER